MWSSFAVALAGASHVRGSVPVQDDAAAGHLDDWAYAIVSDGHGSEKYFRSQIGAALAVETLKSAFEVFVERSKNVNLNHFRNPWNEWVDRYVVAEWNRRVAEHLLGNLDWDSEPLFQRFAATLEEAELREMRGEFRKFRAIARHIKVDQLLPDLISHSPLGYVQGYRKLHASYGATLLGVLVGEKTVHSFQLGDGYIVYIPSSGEPELLQHPPASAMANQTPSLCSPDAVESAAPATRQMRELGAPKAFLVTTDGVPNSYTDFSGFLKFCSDVSLDPDSPAKLPNWLEGISQRGSGDDVSIGMLRQLEGCKT